MEAGLSPQNKRMSHEWLKSFPVIGYRGRHGSVLGKEISGKICWKSFNQRLLSWMERQNFGRITSFGLCHPPFFPYFWPLHAACRMLNPQPRTVNHPPLSSAHPAMEAQVLATDCQGSPLPLSSCLNDILWES